MFCYGKKNKLRKKKKIIVNVVFFIYIYCVDLISKSFWIIIDYGINFLVNLVVI